LLGSVKIWLGERHFGFVTLAFSFARARPATADPGGAYFFWPLRRCLLGMWHRMSTPERKRIGWPE
jgi:hypothetical protein